MCKRLFIVLALFVCGIAGVWADEIDEKQALNEAKAFLASHRSTSISSGKKMSSNTTLKLQGKVSGLYVFNATDGSGFVIVSNDDQTTPILGFGENGNLDTEKMPANMRAWLQGYADEIAWLQKNGSKAAKARADIGATRNLGSHATTEIPPLVNTKWNQLEPYNNLCPTYSGTNKSATGCVATAMAQVMKYHEWPKEDTANGKDGFTTAIPGYTTKSYGIVLTGLPAIRFDWANMKNTYTGSETDATADAVATLMQYCGYSVEMDYGPESGSNTDKVATALKAYFDYKNTTQFVSRSHYTLAKWTDLIYYELENARPVVYGGMSSGGGHEFVCDGYQYRNGTDYFHINWGWGGQSDNYFVLSSLNPKQQGTGGSSSNDGFHYGQDAVIGIQPSTGTGTMSNITPNDINLTLNSITPSIAYKGISVNIKLNITNNSDDDYDGDIYVGVKDGDNYYILDGNNFNIPTGQTRDCVIPYTFDQIGTYQLVLFLPNATGTYSTDCVVKGTLTVENPQINEKVPLYGFYCNELSKSQFIIPSENLRDMYNATLNGVTFYSTNGNVDWENPQFEVYLKEVEETTISVLKDWTTLTKVYTGNLSIVNGLMVIVFDTPYQYHGGNLLMGINQTVEGGDYAKSNWVGTKVTGASLGGYNDGSDHISQQDFLPKTTFDYSALSIPTNLVAEPQPTSATISWKGNDAVTSYNLRYRVDKAFRYDFESAEPWTVDDFPPCTTYDGDGLSTYGISGTTFINSGYTGSVIAFQNGVASSFTAHAGNAFGCFMAGVPTGDVTNNNDWFITPEIEITEGTVFSFWARATSSYTERFKVGVYGSTDGTFASYLAGGTNSYVEASTTWTEYSYPLSAYAGQTIRLAINCVSEDAFGFCIDDIYVGNPDDDSGWITIANVTSPYGLTGLTSETAYEVQVQAMYGDDTSDWTASARFTTLNASELYLYDSQDNSSLIATNNGATRDVTLQGRTLYKDGNWNTLCLPFDLSAAQIANSDLVGADIRALSTAEFSNSTLTLNFTPAAPDEGAVTAITAGTPYIIKWASSETNIENPTFTGVTISNTNNNKVCDLGDGKSITFKGTYTKLSYTADTPSILFLGGANTLYYPKNSASIGAQRAYFELSGFAASESTNTVRAFALNFGNETTGIRSIENGKLKIENEADAWYGLDGRKLNGKPTRKGLYIHNGNKVVIK